MAKVINEKGKTKNNQYRNIGGVSNRLL